MDRRLFLTRAATVAVPAFLMLPAGTAWPRGFRGHGEALGSRFQGSRRDQRGKRSLRRGATNWVHHWNEIAIDASGLDHTPLAAGEARVFGENLGPGRASRAMAIVHIAIFEAVNAIAGGYQSYCGLEPVGDGASMKAAIARLAKALGVDAIWLNPVMVSPMADHGYDVADPRDIDTQADLEVVRR